jgi:ATP-dependent Clp protease adaptor protein ClpS
MEADVISKVSTEPNLTIKEPSMFNVIYLNDDKTTFDFVIFSLVEIFKKTEAEAVQITTDVHKNGSAVVAVLPYEVAEQKGVEVMRSAKTYGYPLVVKIEEAR